VLLVSALGLAVALLATAPLTCDPVLFEDWGTPLSTAAV
jgi:hypothetical protein